MNPKSDLENGPVQARQLISGRTNSTTSASQARPLLVNQGRSLLLPHPHLAFGHKHPSEKHDLFKTELYSRGQTLAHPSILFLMHRASLGRGGKASCPCILNMAC